MKRRWLFVPLIALLALLWWQPRKERHQPEDVEIEAHQQDEDMLAAQSEVREMQLLVKGFLLAVKDPYRPPLGINEDFAKAFTGGNRYGDVYISSNHPALNERGQLVDRWGTPYHFHPRAPDAIDVRSAGPDRILFTADDIGVSP